MDMFPYPSGAGLHVGHPLGYIGTDCYSRYQRMAGFNVLHPMGFDAFGLPAEQYAVQTGTHPRVTTEANIDAVPGPAAPAGTGLRRPAQHRDHRRRVLPLDPVDLPADLQLLVRLRTRTKARPIAELIAEFEADSGRTPDGRPWAELSAVERRQIVDDHRLAYISRGAGQLVPRSGHGAGQRGGHRRRSQRAGQLPRLQAQPAQWMMRITAYADRLLARPGRPGLAGQGQGDAAQLDRSIHWRARRLRRRGRPADPGLHDPAGHPVRRDLHGAGARARAGRRAGRRRRGRRAPDRPGPAGTRLPRRRSPRTDAFAAAKTDVERQAESQGEDRRLHRARTPRTRSTVGRCRSSSPTTCWPATAPARSWRCPAQDERDWEFAEAFDLPIIRTVQPPDGLRRQGVHRGRPGDQLRRRTPG